MVTLPSSLRLTRLPVNWNEQPETFRRWWAETMSAIEQALNAILALPEIEAAIEAANAAAAAAQTAADTANAAADNANSEQALISSYPTNPAPAPLLAADEFGLVTVQDHDRQYGPGTSGPLVGVVGGTVPTAASPGDIVRVWYSDPGRTGGGVTYQISINSAGDPPQGDNIHVVGEVEIPVSGSQDGNGVPPPGYVPLN